MADEQNIPYPKIAKWMQEAMMTYRLREGDYMVNQKDIALKCGLHPVTFGRYLNGDQRPSDSACDAIAEGNPMPHKKRIFLDDFEILPFWQKIIILVKIKFYATRNRLRTRLIVSNYPQNGAKLRSR